MTIQFNTDKTINGSEENTAIFIEKIEDDLRRFSSHITRIEVHLSDENGIKGGLNNIRCLMEARLEGRQPIAVSNQSDTAKQAIAGALDKLKASLSTILERMSNH